MTTMTVKTHQGHRWTHDHHRCSTMIMTLHDHGRSLTMTMTHHDHERSMTMMMMLMLMTHHDRECSVTMLMTMPHHDPGPAGPMPLQLLQDLSAWLHQVPHLQHAGHQQTPDRTLQDPPDCPRDFPKLLLESSRTSWVSPDPTQDPSGPPKPHPGPLKALQDPPEPPQQLPEHPNSLGTPQIHPRTPQIFLRTPNFPSEALFCNASNWD